VLKVFNEPWFHPGFLQIGLNPTKQTVGGHSVTERNLLAASIPNVVNQVISQCCGGRYSAHYKTRYIDNPPIGIHVFSDWDDDFLKKDDPRTTYVVVNLGEKHKILIEERACDDNGLDPKLRMLGYATAYDPHFKWKTEKEIETYARERKPDDEAMTFCYFNRIAAHPIGYYPAFIQYTRDFPHDYLFFIITNEQVGLFTLWLKQTELSDNVVAKSEAAIINGNLMSYGPRLHWYIVQRKSK
jgi:hypothetical protein